MIGMRNRGLNIKIESKKGSLNERLFILPTIDDRRPEFRGAPLVGTRKAQILVKADPIKPKTGTIV